MEEEVFISLEPPAKPYGEPIDDLSKRDKADPKTKSTEAAKAGDEVQPSHLRGSLELWGKYGIYLQNPYHFRVRLLCIHAIVGRLLLQFCLSI